MCWRVVTNLIGSYVMEEIHRAIFFILIVLLFFFGRVEHVKKTLYQAQ
jgi:hypothetical protein